MNSFDRRLRAFSIDTSMIGVALLILMGITIDAELKRYIAIAIYFGVFCLPYLLGKGQTFGKRIQKIKVVWYEKGEIVPKEMIVPNRFYLLLREFTKCLLMVGTFGLYIIVGAIIATGRKDGRTIHDFIFKTQVVAMTRFTTDGIELKRGDAAASALKGYGPKDE